MISPTKRREHLMTTTNLNLTKQQSSALEELLAGVLFEGTVAYQDDQAQEFSALGDIWDALVPHVPIDR